MKAKAKRKAASPAKAGKIFDSVKMVREIRDAMYRERHDPDFDPNEHKRIKAKWTKLLEEELKARKKAA